MFIIYSIRIEGTDERKEGTEHVWVCPEYVDVNS